MLYDFQTTTHGKWILAGEHAVIRQHGALVFPLQDKTLTLSYQTSPKTSLEIYTEYGDQPNHDLSSLFSNVLKHALNRLNKPNLTLHGTFHLTNHIPTGMGLGASAALCVAIARWFMANEFIKETQLYDFSRELEHLFHGQSSGLDIAAVSSTTGIYFKQGHFTPIHQTWEPRWKISSCGTISTTSHCINQVQQLWQTNPRLAASIDEQMSESVENAKLALESHTEQSQSLLGDAIHQAKHCFGQWGLISDPLQAHMETLLKQGARAVKPTGSGGGGMVLSLW